jgi:hypothetical protein
MEAVAITAVILGAVKGEVGLHHHSLGTGHLRRIEGYADTR